MRARRLTLDSEPTKLLAGVMRGLRGSPKSLSPTLFYDETGAALFERITTLDTYYLTRAELEILQERTAEIAALAGAGCALIEYGSGAGLKTRLLLESLDSPVEYVPIDISLTQLKRVSAEIAAVFPRLSVRAVHADYSAPFSLPDLPQRARRVAFFPGSTIGNFHPTEAAAFLRRVRRTVGTDGAMVLGVDRVKDRETLLAAYDEAEGVTAKFNLNVLTRLNRELGADFDLTCFRHVAMWNGEAARIEMHLESVGRQVVHVGGQSVQLRAGETIWTESSYKYDRERLDSVVTAGGFRVTRLWTDPNELFWVAFLTVAHDPARRGGDDAHPSGHSR